MIENLKSYVIEGRGQTLLKIINNSAIHLQNVVNDVLDMSRIENGKFEIFKEEFNLSKAVHEVVDILEF